MKVNPQPSLRNPLDKRPPATQTLTHKAAYLLRFQTHRPGGRVLVDEGSYNPKYEFKQIDTMWLRTYLNSCPGGRYKITDIKIHN